MLIEGGAETKKLFILFGSSMGALKLPAVVKWMDSSF